MVSGSTIPPARHIAQWFHRFFVYLARKAINASVASRNSLPIWRYGIALVVLSVVIILRAVLAPALESELPFLGLFVAVAFTIWFCGTRPAILVMIVGEIVSEFLYIHPFTGTNLSDPHLNVERLMYLLTAAVIIILGYLAARAERISHHQKVRLELAEQAATAGYYEWDIKNDRSIWSHELRLIYGVPDTYPATLESWKQLLHPEDRDRTTSEFLEAGYVDKTDFEHVHKIVTPAGEMKYVLFRDRIFRDSRGAPEKLVGLAIDITQQRVVEAALLRSEKLVAASRMASTVSHEINNPLQAILSMLFLIRTDSSLSPYILRLVDKADHEIRRVAALAQRSLRFFHDTRVSELLDLGQLVSYVVDIHRRRADAAKIEVQVSVDWDCAIRFNPEDLNQVLSNLIVNAIDAMSKTGGRLEIYAIRKEEFVELTVKDSGTGIDAAHVSKVFDPFFTTKGIIGTGLGLWASKEIVEACGGSLEVETSTWPENHGTRFIMKLPLARQRAFAAH